MDQWNDPLIVPPPLKYINSSLLSIFPRYVQELVNAMWFAISSRDLWRYERVALAYHQTYIIKFFGPDTGARIRQVRRASHQYPAVAKRMPTTLQNETKILQTLSRKCKAGSRQYIAIPLQFIWGQRLHITWQYHQLLDLAFKRKGVLDLSLQLAESVAFLHNNRIAHLDISPRNFLVACNPDLPGPRLLLIDMELAVCFEDGVEPKVTLWEPFFAPPEGKTDIDAFAYDVLGMGLSIEYFIQNCTVTARNEEIKWPERFRELHERMVDDQPYFRPSAKDVERRLQQICEDDAESLYHDANDPGLFFIGSIGPNPALRGSTPLPGSHEFAMEGFDW